MPSNIVQARYLLLAMFLLGGVTGCGTDAANKDAAVDGSTAAEVTDGTPPDDESWMCEGERPMCRRPDGGPGICDDQSACGPCMFDEECVRSYGDGAECHPVSGTCLVILI